MDQLRDPAEVARLRDSGMTWSEIARHYGLPPGQHGSLVSLLKRHREGRSRPMSPTERRRLLDQVEFLQREGLTLRQVLPLTRFRKIDTLKAFLKRERRRRRERRALPS